MDEDKIGTPGCVLVGYLTQYFLVRYRHQQNMKLEYLL